MPIEGQNGSSSGVGDPVTLGFVLADIAKGKPKPFFPLGTPNAIFRTQEMIGTTERKIAEAVRLGNPVPDADFKRLSTLNDRLQTLERRLETQRRKNPRSFARVGITAATTLAQILDFVSGTSRGQQIISRFRSPTFNPAPLPSIGGTSTMPFVVTPAASSTSSFGGFGDLVNRAIDFGGRALSDFFSPQRREELQVGINQPRQAGFPLVPFARPLLQAGRGLLPGLGVGAVGGELADAFQNLLRGRGGSQDDSAAFTDPIPGSCRPKMHLQVNPCTGKEVWFTPRGRPLVFSGDMSACKRVDRVSKRLQKAMPRRHHHHRTATRKR